jgi:hypothetical protein
MFSRAMLVMPLTKARSPRSMGSVPHSLVLASQMAWPIRINVRLLATRCKLRSALVKWVAARKFIQQMIHKQHHLIPYSILVKDPHMFIMLSRGNTLTIGNISWHTTPGAFVFQPHIHRRFIPVSFV